MGKKRRRWWIRIPVAFLVLALLIKGGFELWRFVVVPGDAPRIAFSVDDTWLNDLGITRASYDQAMARAGGELVTLEPDDAGSERVDPDRVRELLADMDGLLLTGGGDVDPELYGASPDTASSVNRLRDDFEMALIREARRRRLPILGICRGCQILNVAHGGSLRNLRADAALSESHFGMSGHAVQLEAGSILGELFGVASLDSVQSFHGQAVDRPGDGVRVSARTADGVSEAIEIGGADEWIVAVQWHPELAIIDDRQLEIFRAFVARAQEAQERRVAR